MGRLINIHYDSKPLYNINIEQDFSGLPAVFESLRLKNRKRDKKEQFSQRQERNHTQNTHPTQPRQGGQQGRPGKNTPPQIPTPTKPQPDQRRPQQDGQAQNRRNPLLSQID